VSLTATASHSLPKSLHPALNHRAHVVVDHVADWLIVERGKGLNPEQRAALGQLVQDDLSTLETKTAAYLKTHLDIDPATTPMADKLMGNINHVLQGKPGVGWLITHALAFMYVPGSVIAPFVVNDLYKRSGKLDDDTRHKLVTQYTSERVTGAGIHFLPIYGGKLFTDGMKRVAQQHFPLSQWATSQEGKLPGLVTHSAHALAKGLRSTWHVLNDTRGDTLVSVGMMALFNTIGYGVVRPWLTAKTAVLTFGPPPPPPNPLGCGAPVSSPADSHVQPNAIGVIRAATATPPVIEAPLSQSTGILARPPQNEEPRFSGLA
jgi:hypothetical protein